MLYSSSFGLECVLHRFVRPYPLPPLASPQTTSPAADPERFWGTYRPHTYFGLRTRTPDSVAAGLAFLDVPLIHSRGPNEPVPVRHYCDNVAGQRYLIFICLCLFIYSCFAYRCTSLALANCAPQPHDRYGWEVHDGRNMGVHEVLESGVEVRAEWVKVMSFGADGNRVPGGDWSARIVARPGPRASSRGQQQSRGGPPSPPAPLVSLMFYVHTPHDTIVYEIDPKNDPNAAHGTVAHPYICRFFRICSAFCTLSVQLHCK